MPLKNKTTQKFISSIIIFAMLVPALVLFSKPKEAKAQWIVNDPIHTAVTVKIVVVEILKQMLMTVARKIINQITQSTINWVNEGSWGSPLFLENPDSFFKDIVKYEIKTLVDIYGYDPVRYPFGKAFALNTINAYKRQASENAAYTLSKVINDPVLLKGYQTDFNVGGWNAFLINTQYPQNNYLGFQMLANEELARKLQGTSQNAAEKTKEALDQGMGFLSPQTCMDNNGNNKFNDTMANQFKKPTWNDAEYEKAQPYENPYECNPDRAEGEDECAKWQEYDTEWNSFKAAAKASWTEDNTCKNLANTTPGSVVASQITNAMGSKFRQSELGAALGNSFASIFDALLNKLMQKGLNTLTNKNPAPEEDVLDENDFLNDTAAGINAGYFVENTNKLTEKYIDTIVPRGSGGSGGGVRCADSGNSYGDALEEAENAVLEENPEIGSLPNIEAGGRQNARAFLNLVQAKLKSMGFKATVEVLNGNNNPSTGDIIAIWKDGDELMERYDAIYGGAKTIKEAALANFDAFIPLNCYNGGEGEKDCGCKTAEEENPEEPDPNPTTNPNPNSGDSYISLITPVIAKPGTTTLTITGDNLTNQISFFDGNEGRNTVVGSLNSTKTQVTVLVPANQPIGNATVKIYQGKDSNNEMIFSNGKLIKISNESTGTITTTAPTTTWSPTQTTNGWWPELSPDGKYVAYGNWGESWVTNLETKENYNFAKPTGLPDGARCIAGQWIESDTLSFVCELNQTQFSRYEVKVGEWIAKKTTDDTNLVAGNITKAKDGHWASWLAAGKRIARDNEVILNNVGGALSISNNMVAYACDSENSKICLWKDTGSITQYTPKAPVHQISIKNGYILYGGYGPVRGISSSGLDINLRLSSTLNEGVGQIFLVNGAPWVATVAWEPEGSKVYILLRPWKELKALAIEADAAGVNVTHKGNEFVIAYWSAVGKMNVITVPSDSPRSFLE